MTIKSPTLNRRRQRGDTIVEVMISVAVTALILTAAFVLANETSKSTRQAQERSEALNIAQAEAEGLISYLTTSSIPTAISKFCIDSSATPATIASATPANCKRQNLYRVEISESSIDNTYDVAVIWPSVKSNGDDTVIMTIRTYGK